MKSIFSKYLSKEEWLIREKGYFPDKRMARESMFTLGNGYLGSRGIYEEIPDGTEPGTYIAGVYDAAASMVPELVNAPNPIDFRIIVEGEKLDVDRMNILENERILDLKKGLLTRRTVFSDTRGRRFLYESLRFFSLHDTNIGCMQVYLKALDNPARIIVQDTVDDSVTNIGSLLEGRKRHSHLVDVSTVGDMNYLCVKTFTNKIWIAYASFLAVARGPYDGMGTLNKIFNLTIKKRESICFTKIFSIHTSRHISYKKLERITTKDLHRAKMMGLEKLLERHIKAWQEKWQSSDVRIKGDKEVQKALHFNIYHLIISGKENDENVSIGARTLSGNGYRGHVFWDTELFILPFFIYTNPKVARNLLMYRYRRINIARKIAWENGYKGVLFPWESADTGEDTTPPYAKNLDGTIIEIHTGAMEHHIMSDIAYAACHYFAATADMDFMFNAGLEIMFETARFWASRVVYNKTTKSFDIRKVIGPDEFHEGVDNNAYTNRMAKWNLQKAIDLYYKFSNENPRMFKKVKRKLSINEKEIEEWSRIADRIKTPRTKSKGIIEEFDGYFKKKDVILDKFNHHFMPVLPKNVKLGDISKTQLVKQPDVVMLMYLLPEAFTEHEKAQNYSYYVKRTLHKSSLSPSIYSIIASEVNDRTRGYLFFLFSLYADLKDTHGNTKEGIHAASLGGTWQATIMGFAGFRIIDEMPSFEPSLPGHWRSISFILRWKKCDLNVKVSNRRVTLFVSSKKGKGSILIKCFNAVHKIPFNKKYIIHNREKR